MTQPSDRYLILVRNITARKRAENALRESEERYRSLAESAEDIIFIVSPENRIEYVNQYAAKLLGKRPEEIRGNTNQGYFHFLEAKEPNQEITEVFQNSIPVHAENHVRIGEHELWLSTHLVPLKDPFGKVKSVLGVSRDISERKALELLERDQKNQLEQRVAERTAELAASHEQLRQLARQVVSAQEDERRHLAREIHDESGQALLDLKFTLDEVLSDLPVDPELVRQKASRVFGKIDSLDQQLHALSSGLRPPILDVAGIDLALRSLCQETSKKKQLNVTYQGLELPDLPEEIAITLYRCVQEALTNMHKYAQATEARVKLEYISPGPIRLSVWDNGIGFEIGSISRGIGLSGMEERFDLLGGHLEINSAPGQGTHLKAVVPFPHAPTS
jgi:PAS domain S-box-containing protein